MFRGFESRGVALLGTAPSHTHFRHRTPGWFVAYSEVVLTDRAPSVVQEISQEESGGEYTPVLNLLDAPDEIPPKEKIDDRYMHTIVDEDIRY